jgi:hypothetical protein
LISHVGKTLERLIQNRLVVKVDCIPFLPEAQCGFRKNRSTVDVMFCSKMLSSFAKEKQVPIYKCFVDLTKAYDKVDRSILWKVLERRGIPTCMIELIRNTLDGSEAKVRINGKLSDSFKLERGLKQGSVFSPLLFNLFFGAIIQEVRRRCKQIGLNGVKLRCNIHKDIFNTNDIAKGGDTMHIFELLFADDAELVAESVEELQKIIDIFDEVCKVFGQEISIKKTEVMMIPGRGQPVQDFDIFIDNQKLKVIKEFKYSQLKN